jgi:DNA-binding response OmpR family regulator
LDFVNYAVPELIARLAEHKQQLRAGLDFGLVEFKKNSLIGANEVVGGPGMVATRLEEAAESGKIFCSNTVHSIFVHNWPEMFSATAHSVKCKDRELLAYEVLPMDSAELQNVFFLLVSPEDQKAVEAVMKTRRRVLVVDDEEWLLEMVSVALSQRFPLFEVETASDGREGLTKYEAAPFDLVLADINMERMDGYELTRAILNRNPEQLVVIMTGLGDRYERRVAFGLGAFDFLPKPFAIDTLYGVLTKALLHLGTCRARKALGALADEPGLVLSLSHAVASRYRGILLRTAKATDLANTMLRHKTKQVVRDFAGASEYPLSQSRARDSSGEVGEDVW